MAIRPEGGTPLYVKNVATVSLGPEFRRGALDKAGVEAVGGVVAMRYGENPLTGDRAGQGEDRRDLARACRTRRCRTAASRRSGSSPSTTARTSSTRRWTRSRRP